MAPMIIIVMGVAGSGKTTVGTKLAAALFSGFPGKNGESIRAR